MRLVVEGRHGLAVVVVAHDADEEGDTTTARMAHGFEHLVDRQRLVPQRDERDRVGPGRHGAPGDGGGTIGPDRGWL